MHRSGRRWREAATIRGHGAKITRVRAARGSSCARLGGRGVTSLSMSRRRAFLGAGGVLAATLWAGLGCGAKPLSAQGPEAGSVAVGAAETRSGGSVSGVLRASTPVDLSHVGVPIPDDSVCEKNPDGSIKNAIEPGKYRGILRNAQCDQQRFLTMANLTKRLNIRECTYCHAPDPNNPKSALYEVMTEKKVIANWMLTTFVDGLQRNDGKQMTCDSCHTDGKGNGVMKILHQPRDLGLAQEWMNEVMTASFQLRSGKRQRCKTCHVGMAPGQEGWDHHVIQRLESRGGDLVRVPLR
ncbi:MAG: hypothetical protein EXR75_09905 [Myxococcales bacterium]|nr:hypothetical protein [Myxococcales bacterium]